MSAVRIVALLVVAACWRGSGPIACPPGKVATGEGTSSPRCEVRHPVIVKRPRYRCQYLSRLVGQLPPPSDGMQCTVLAGHPFLFPQCMMEYYELRAGYLQNWIDRAIAMCAPDLP